MTRWVKGFGKVFFRICLLAMAGWATIAILYSNLPDFCGRGSPASSVLSVWSLLSGCIETSRSAGIFGCICGRARLVSVDSAVQHRNWQPDLAVLPRQTIRGPR